MDAETYQFNRYVAEFRRWEDLDRILSWVLSQPRISPEMLNWMFKHSDEYRSEL
jgi:hypothetical protein